MHCQIENELGQFTESNSSGKDSHYNLLITILIKLFLFGLQTGPTTMLPESSPQSDWLRRELDSRFLASQDRVGPRGLPSPFMVQPSAQPQLGPPGSLMRPVMPPPPGASFLARSLVQIFETIYFIWFLHWPTYFVFEI
jgi:hypothetical protein